MKLLVRPIHSIDFLERHNLGVEAHIGRYDVRPGWQDYVPFVEGVHLPYGGCNLAALERTKRSESIDVIKKAIDTAEQYRVDRYVMHICGFEQRGGVVVGAYEPLLDSIRELAAYAGRQGRKLCLENPLVQWGSDIVLYADTPQKWLQIYKDVACDNVLLTFDSSHATSSAQRRDTPEGRAELLLAYLAEPAAIGRVHWSDSVIATDEGKRDMHLVPGDGDLPRELHRLIKGLPVVKLLEQTCPEEDVVRALRFIATL